MALSLVSVIVLTGCFGGRAASSSGRGGEVVGVGGGKAFSEPSPYGMIMVKRGSLKMGVEKQDTLWGKQTPVKEISVDGFWMDDTEVTNSKYKQFVYWVRDSILRERLADPAYGGDETYKITEDKNGDPIKPYLNWKKPLPRKPNEDEQRAFESLYVTNPVTGEKLLDWRQLNYRYEIYDYTAAALRRNRLNPEERTLNTDIVVDAEEVVMISKDTAYVDDEGRIVRETINRPLSGPWDFLHTYIVNVYPDTTCWVNDFRNSDNEMYLRNYFSNVENGLMTRFFFTEMARDLGRNVEVRWDGETKDDRKAAEIVSAEVPVFRSAGKQETSCSSRQTRLTAAVLRYSAG